MKTLALIFTALACACSVQAQTVVLDYDMSLTPDQQGFALVNSCGTDWNATGSVLEYRGCTDSPAASMARYDGLLTGASSAQVDMRLRVLDSDGYAFEVYVGRGSPGRYFQLTAADFGNDTDWHDVTFFVDFAQNVSSVYIDDAQASVQTSLAIEMDTFIIGDGNSWGTWGNVDISLLKVTVGLAEPVADEASNWGNVKSMYR